MAARNPNIPSERVKEIETAATIEERDATSEFAKKQASLAEKQSAFGQKQAEDARGEDAEA